MRKINPYILTLLIPVIFFNCTKEANDLLDDNEKFYNNNPDVNAMVKFIHAYTPLTLNGLATGTNGFRITMDGTKVNGATNTSATTNTLMYGGNIGATNYTVSFFPTTNSYTFLNPGLRNIKFIMNRITGGNFAPITGDEIFNTNLTLTGGKKYSIFIADPFPSPNVLQVTDNLPDVERGKFALRLVNVCGDVNSKFDLVSRRFGNLFTNVSYREVKDFVIMDLPSISDTIYLRTAGTTTNITTFNGFIPAPERVYTFFIRGNAAVAGRTANLNYYTNW